MKYGGRRDGRTQRDTEIQRRVTRRSFEAPVRGHCRRNSFRFYDERLLVVGRRVN